jgi:trigger factor
LLKTCEDISATKKRLTIEIAADKVEAEIRKELLEAQSKTKMPGFRPGKAPLSMIEKKYGKGIESEVVDKLVPEAYMAAVKEAGIKPMSRPKLDAEVDFKRSEPILLSLTVDVRPVIENLVYDNIEVTDIPVEIKEEEIDVIMKSLAAERGTFETVDAAAETGDLATVDFTTDGGVEKKDVVVKIGSGPFPKEFFDAFIGRKAGDEFQAEAAFPEDSPSEFSGKTVKFSLKMKEVKRHNMPPLDDELAKDMGMESLAALREQVKADVENMKKAENDRKKQIEIMDKILADHSFEAPEGLVQSELKRLIAEARAMGLKEKTDEELETEFRQRAEKNAKITCILDMVGEKEKVEVTEEELKQEIYSFSMRYNVSPDNVIKYYVSRDGSLEGVRNAIFDRKTMRMLLEKAKKQKE